jgi:hypothetical protein
MVTSSHSPVCQWENRGSDGSALANGDMAQAALATNPVRRKSRRFTRATLPDWRRFGNQKRPARPISEVCFLHFLEL